MPEILLPLIAFFVGVTNIFIDFEKPELGFELTVEGASVREITLEPLAHHKNEITPVKSALLGLDFKFTEGEPGIPDVGTNAIFFGDKVPIEDVKLVALTLIRAGVEIKYIRPFKNSTGRSLLIQVGAGTAYVSKPPLSVEAITDAKNFPL